MKQLTYDDNLTRQKKISSATYKKGTYIDECAHLIEELKKGAQIELHKATDHENGVCSVKVTIFFFQKPDEN